MTTTTADMLEPGRTADMLELSMVLYFSLHRPVYYAADGLFALLQDRERDDSSNLRAMSAAVPTSQIYFRSGCLLSTNLFPENVVTSTSME